MSKPARWLLGALAVALGIALALWIATAIEWVDVSVPVFAKGEAARDPLYAAKQLARKLGANVATVRSFDRLPPASATLVLATPRWNMFPGRDAALQRWVRDGGRLVALQSAWSAASEAPPWVPIRSQRRAREAASAVTAAPAASAASAASDPMLAISKLMIGPCRRYAEPERSDGAFGSARAYRVCGRPSRTLRAAAPSWQIGADDGAVAVRVALDRGEVTSNAIEGSFENPSIVREDGALAFAAMLQLRPGDDVWFLVDETRTPFLIALWEHGAPALALALAALALALWRGGTRFGPRLLDAPPARRSIGEQVRRTAAFIVRGNAAALHAASVRALEEEARRSIASYAGLLGRSERSEAIARRTDGDLAALAAAMAPQHDASRRSAAAAIQRLERARRALVSGRSHFPHRPQASSEAPAP